MTENLKELLAGADTLGAAFQALQGKELVVENGLPNPPKFTVLETKSDYFVGQWKDVQFFSRYKMKKVFSLPK